MVHVQHWIGCCPNRHTVIFINMKRTLRLSESELVNLIGKIIEEQSHNEDVFEEYMLAIEQIANEFNKETTEDELDYMMSDIERLLDSAVKEDELTDDQIEELHDYASDIARELEFEFRNMQDLNEGTRAKKPRPMKSRRSGIKTQKRIDQNHEVLKKLVKEDIDLDVEDKDEEIEHPAMARQLRHFDPDEFVLIGRIQVVQNPPAKTPNFVLRTRNKTEDGTRILGGVELFGYDDKIVKLTGVTKNGKPPSFQNPMKLTKRPQILSR